MISRENRFGLIDLGFYVNYLGGNMATFALNFSRPGGSVIAQYSQLLRLGKEPDTEIQQVCMETGKFRAHQPGDLEFEMLYSSEGGLPGVVFKLKEDVHGFTLYDLQNQVKQRGWQTAAYPLPNNRENTVIMRVLIRYGVSTTLMNLLAQDIRNIVDQLQAKAVTHEAALG